MAEIISKTEIKHADVYAVAAIGAYGSALGNKYIPQYAGKYTVAINGGIQFIIGLVAMPYNKYVGSFFIGAGMFSLLDGAFRLFAPAYAI